VKVKVMVKVKMKEKATAYGPASFQLLDHVNESVKEWSE
jgi:hypothetical protein